MASEELNDVPQTNGEMVVPQERVKRPTRPDDVAQKAKIDELQASSTSNICVSCQFLDLIKLIEYDADWSTWRLMPLKG